MQFKKSLMTATLITIGGFAVMSSANAKGPVTSSFTSTIEVESICTIKAAPIAVAFDNVQAGKATTALTSQTNLILNCSKGAVAVIGLTPASTDSLLGVGNMLGGDGDLEQVSYKLSSDVGGLTAWGATDTVSTEAAEKYGTDITTPIYLTLTNAADVKPGSYTDTINVSVTY